MHANSTLAAASLLLAHPAMVFAADAADPQPLILITGGRVVQTAEQSLVSFTVIDREEIERRQATSVPDLLRGVPGLSLSNSGGPGKNTSVFLRGTESSHVLVLIDGVKMGSATLGSTAFQDLPVEQIERIEIVRGPRSSLYGSEAIGGVIQIFTRKGGGDWRPSLSLGGGSHRTFQGAVNLAGGGADGWFNANLSGLDTQGFNACDGEPGVGGCFTREPDQDGYRNVSGSLRAGYRFANGIELDAHWLRAQSHNEFDGGFQNESDTLQQVLGTRLKLTPGAYWTLTLQAGRSQDESDNFKDGAFSSRFTTERDLLALQNDFHLNLDHGLTLGLDYQEDRVGGDTDYAVTSRDNWGLFGQYLGHWGRHRLQLNLRGDDNQQAGTQTTGSLGWGYAIGNGLRLTASHGTAFKAPTFNDLYFPDYGNPDLRPEESASLELGLAGIAPWGGWTLNLYQTDIDDLIAYDADRMAPGNIDAARIRGLEGTLDTRLGAWDLKLSLTLLDPENTSSDTFRGNQLPRRAEQAARLDLDRDLGPFRVGATLNGVGSRYDDLANTRELDPYLTLDLRGDYRLAKDWRAQARLDNLFDADYETAAYYNQPGRSLFLTLRYEPQP